MERLALHLRPSAAIGKRDGGQRRDEWQLGAPGCAGKKQAISSAIYGDTRPEHLGRSGGRAGRRTRRALEGFDDPERECGSRQMLPKNASQPCIQLGGWETERSKLGQRGSRIPRTAEQDE